MKRTVRTKQSSKAKTVTVGGQSDFEKVFKKVKGWVGKNYQAGDDVVIADAAEAIINCERVLLQIKEEGDIVRTRNGFTAVNQLYKILKIWQAQKMDALIQLGLTPKARKQISGSAEGDGVVSEPGTGRKASKASLKETSREEEAEEYC